MRPALRSIAFCLTAWLVLATPGHALEPLSLSGKYHEIEAKLQVAPFGLPLYVESSDEDGLMRVDVYGVFSYAFDIVQGVLETPATWCDIAPLHINIKACTYQKADAAWLLTFYNGRKDYQSPEEAQPLQFTFHHADSQPRHVSIVLTAEKGPTSTRNHRLGLEAMPLEGNKTFLHYSYSYRYGLLAKIAMQSYFSTVGRSKVGFTVSELDATGKPVYIGGIKGAVERNAVRFYLAVQAYLDTLEAPEAQRLEQRLTRWYDLTMRYRRQLFDLEKSDYLSFKRQEHKNQLRLQGVAPTLREHERAGDGR